MVLYTVNITWENVTDDVLYRCWERTGIMPDNEGVEQAMGIDTEVDEENKVQLLIDQININGDDIITARSYIEIDSGSATEMLDDEEDVSSPISNKIALESIQILSNLLEQNNDIRVRKQINSLKQTSMDIYLNKQ